MTYEQFNAFCRALPATCHVVQWGGSHVWKVGGKVFAVGGWQEGSEAGFTFKVGAVAFEMPKGQPGLRPAPYLASRGTSWMQHFAQPGLSDGELQGHLRRSHRLVAASLPRRTRAELGGMTGTPA